MAYPAATDYQCCSVEDIADPSDALVAMTNLVTGQIALGWTPVGGVLCIAKKAAGAPASEFIYVQTMCKF